MSNNAKRECLDAIRARYRLARKPIKKLILNEFCDTCGKRLKAMIPLWLPHEQTTGAEARKLLLCISAATLAALTSIEAALPFRLQGFDCDNGSEFMNWTILDHYTKRKRPRPTHARVNITRTTMRTSKEKIGHTSDSTSGTNDLMTRPSSLCSTISTPPSGDSS